MPKELQGQEIQFDEITNELTVLYYDLVYWSLLSSHYKSFVLWQQNSNYYA